MLGCAESRGEKKPERDKEVAVDRVATNQDHDQLVRQLHTIHIIWLWVSAVIMWIPDFCPSATIKMVGTS